MEHHAKEKSTNLSLVTLTLALHQVSGHHGVCGLLAQLLAMVVYKSVQETAQTQHQLTVERNALAMIRSLKDATPKNAETIVLRIRSSINVLITSAQWHALTLHQQHRASKPKHAFQDASVKTVLLMMEQGNVSKQLIANVFIQTPVLQYHLDQFQLRIRARLVNAKKERLNAKLSHVTRIVDGHHGLRGLFAALNVVKVNEAEAEFQITHQNLETAKTAQKKLKNINHVKTSHAHPNVLVPMARNMKMVTLCHLLIARNVSVIQMVQHASHVLDQMSMVTGLSGVNGPHAQRHAKVVYAPEVEHATILPNNVMVKNVQERQLMRKIATRTRNAQLTETGVNGHLTLHVQLHVIPVKRSAPGHVVALNQLMVVLIALVSLTKPHLVKTTHAQWTAL